MVEAGGIEPTVRRTDHRSISERRLQFRFCSAGAYSRAPLELSRWILLEPSENWVQASPFKWPPSPGHGPSAGRRL